MSEQLMTDAAALNPDQVAAWLAAHPQFFADHPEVLTSLRLPHGEAGTVSLVERQLSQLRDDNQQLRARIDQLLPAAEKYGEHHLCTYGVVSGMMVMAVSLLMFA